MLVGWRWTISKRVAVQGKMSRDDTSKNLFGVAAAHPHGSGRHGFESRNKSKNFKLIKKGILTV